MVWCIRLSDREFIGSIMAKVLPEYEGGPDRPDEISRLFKFLCDGLATRVRYISVSVFGVVGAAIEILPGTE